MYVFEKYRNAFNRLKSLNTRVDLLETELNYLRSKLDVSEELENTFAQARKSPEYQAVFAKSEPLVTICIGTYNRADLLVERSVASALAQTYKNIEVVVVGDHCTDSTAERMVEIKDERLRFVNLPERGDYPAEPELRWMVAGTATVNKALELAKGDFITHLDDDDEHLPDRVEKLLARIQSSKADLVYHPFYQQKLGGGWRINQAGNFRKMQVTTSSIFYHCWLAQIPWDIKAYKYHEPGDWNRLRKLQYLGVTLSRFPEPLLRHYRERNQK